MNVTISVIAERKSHICQKKADMALSISVGQLFRKELFTFYERLRRKKHPHVARVALARKLLTAVYAMLRDGEEFSETEFAAM